MSVCVGGVFPGTSLSRPLFLFPSDLVSCGSRAQDATGAGVARGCRRAASPLMWGARGPVGGAILCPRKAPGQLCKAGCWRGRCGGEQRPSRRAWAGGSFPGGHVTSPPTHRKSQDIPVHPQEGLWAPGGTHSFCPKDVDRLAHFPPTTALCSGALLSCGCSPHPLICSLSPQPPPHPRLRGERPNIQEGGQPGNIQDARSCSPKGTLTRKPHSLLLGSRNRTGHPAFLLLFYF